ncbi:hypothetical protein BGZ76_009775 [Entomortierella beljakovae]|nr:hypothetical protein BGZ76_009775 [Entomortierella beljakovae]
MSDNARKRASIRALGSITYLQKYYASGGMICEGILRLDSSKTSFVDLISPRAGLMPPSAETLFKNCHEDIQSVLEIWGIISYPATNDKVPDSPISSSDENESYRSGHDKDLSSTSINTKQQRRYDSVTVDMLALLESSTKAISSIRTYSIHAPFLTPGALTIHRQAALAVVEMLSVLEQNSRVIDDDEEYIQPEDYCYASLTFGDLEDERLEMKKYLTVVQEQLFKPQAEKLETQLEQLLISDSNSNALGEAALPRWMRDSEWPAEEDGELSLDRCHEFLEFFRPDTRGPLSSPSANKDGFLEELSDGYIMCMVFNAFIRLTNMPFGLVDKIHEETSRTWRAADNWRFLLQACKFRLEFKIAEGSFKPIDIVKRTDVGILQLQAWVKLIVQRGIQEAKEALENKKSSPPVIAPNLFPDF